MALRLSQPTSRGMLSIGFNQDASCIISSGFKGITIYSIDNNSKIIELQDIGGVSLSSMLYCTSLLAFSGSGEPPTSTPRKLTLYNTHSNSVISTLLFPTSVLGINLNRKYLCAVLESEAQLYSLESVRLICTFATPPNPKGLAALSLDSQPSYLVLPASQIKGTLAIHTVSTSSEEGSVLEIDAHQSPLAAMQWNADGSMLATASIKGTVIRVFKMPEGSKIFNLRRGTSPARVTSMAFTPPSQQPPYLFVASDHSTVHVFRLSSDGSHPKNPAAAVASSVFSSVINKQSITGGYKVLTIRLPCKKGTSLACGVPKSAAAALAETEGAGAGSSMRVAVVTAEGMLYMYSIEGLHDRGGPKACLEGEWLVS